MKRFLAIAFVSVFLMTLNTLVYSQHADHEDHIKTEETLHQKSSDEAHVTYAEVEHNEAVEEQHSDGHIESDHGHAPHLDGMGLSLLWIIPFLGILLSIAVFPLVAPHFWHHHYGKISLFWGVAFLIAFTISNSINLEAFSKGLNMSAFYLAEVYLGEFIPFIVLLLALFTVGGGIRLKGELVGTPKLNLMLILIGTILASWMGTTGAAMLMIRPVIRANAWRNNQKHVIIFFIFLVANIGGSLTPLGDPPLFLGFLKGVDFFWTTTHMFKPMLFVVVILLGLFFIIDSYFYKKEKNKPVKVEGGEKFGLEGTSNFILLLGIIAAVIFSGIWHSDISNPADWGIVMWGTGLMTKGTVVQVAALLLIVFISIKITPDSARRGNDFTWEPIKEVAKLFATIFITMVPVIAMLKAGSDGPLAIIINSVKTPDGEFVNSAFFWATGALSSFLDNAPTYVVFFNTALGENLTVNDLMTTFAPTLLAISAGAVFMGSMTYIGNAPNFMVKSIAEENKIKMPSFFGYMVWSILILVPTFILATFIFFR